MPDNYKKNNKALIMAKNNQKGMTLVESLVSALILIIILEAALGVYFNLQKSQQLGQDDANMQSQARTAMMNITTELRQAHDVWMPKIPISPKEPYSKDIRFSIPVVDTASNLYGYKIIRYWYVKNPESFVWSLRKFVWNKINARWCRDNDPQNRNLTASIHGNLENLSLSNAAVTSTNEQAQPSNAGAYNGIIMNSSVVLQEAAVIDPGIQSYFIQDVNNLNIRLVTAVYKIKSDATNINQKQLDRTFVLNSKVELRNVN